MKKPSTRTLAGPIVEHEEESGAVIPAEYQLFGKPLRPWSASRKAAANEMGVLFPVIGQQGFEQYQKTGTYSGMLKDVIASLWLMSLPDEFDITREDRKAAQEAGVELWTPTRATWTPREAFSQALAWAESEEIDLITVSSERFASVAPMVFAILQDTVASEFYVSSDKGSSGGGGDDSGKV